MRTLMFTAAALAMLPLAATAAPNVPAAKPGAASPAPAAKGPTAVPRTLFITTMDSEFARMDADHNKILTRKEVETVETARLAAVVEQRRLALFTALDTDHNGIISPQEFARLEIPAPKVNIAPLFAQNDGNKDGQITLVEYRTAKLANFDRMDADKDGVVSPAEMKAAGLIK